MGHHAGTIGHGVFPFGAPTCAATRHRTSSVLGICGDDGHVPVIDLLGVHRRKHCPRVLHHGGVLRGIKLVRLHHQEKPLRHGLVPDDGLDRDHHRHGDQYLLGIKRTAFRDFRYWGPGVRWFDRL